MAESWIGPGVGEADGDNRAGQDGTSGRSVGKKLDDVSTELYANVGWRNGMAHC